MPAPPFFIARNNGANPAANAFAAYAGLFCALHALVHQHKGRGPARGASAEWSIAPLLLAHQLAFTHGVAARAVLTLGLTQALHALWQVRADGPARARSRALRAPHLAVGLATAVALEWANDVHQALLLALLAWGARGAFARLREGARVQLRPHAAVLLLLVAALGLCVGFLGPAALPHRTLLRGIEELPPASYWHVAVAENILQ